MEDEENIKKEVGASEWEILKGNNQRYFLLLLKTKVVVNNLVKQSKKKLQDLADMLEVARDGATNKGKVPQDDKELFDEAMGSLLKWIDESKLVEMTKEWSDLCTDLAVEYAFMYMEPTNVHFIVQHTKPSANRIISARFRISFVGMTYDTNEHHFLNLFFAK